MSLGGAHHSHFWNLHRAGAGGVGQESTAKAALCKERGGHEGTSQEEQNAGVSNSGRAKQADKPCDSLDLLPLTQTSS